MDRNQAKAVAAAILEPHLREQQGRAHRARGIKANETANRRRGRIVIPFLIAGTAVGGVAAYFTGTRLASGLYWGVVVGGLLGWAVAYTRVRGAGRQATSGRES